MTRKLAGIATKAVLSILFGLIVGAIAILIGVPKAVHGSALTVLTGSMTPTIPVGSVVVVRPVDPGTLHVGDVATYQKQPGKAEYITHRIIRIDTSTTPTSFIFKGDANRGPDVRPVPATAIRGKVWFHVPYLGTLRDTLHTGGGIAGVAVLALAGYAAFQLVGAVKDRNSSKCTAPVQPDRDDQQGPEARLVILAVLRVNNLGGLAAQSVARLLGGVLVDADDSTFTVIVVERSGRAPQTLALLETFEPVSIHTATPTPWKAPEMLVESAAELSEPSVETLVLPRV